jgi:hypothetical protein
MLTLMVLYTPWSKGRAAVVVVVVVVATIRRRFAFGRIHVKRTSVGGGTTLVSLEDKGYCRFFRVTHLVIIVDVLF